MSNIFNSEVPATFFGSSGNATQGVDFVAEHTGQVLGVWWWSTAAGGPSQITIAIFDTITQAVVASQVSAVVLTPNAWTLVPFAAPVTVTPGHVYTAAAFYNGNFGFTSNRMTDHVYRAPLTALLRTARFNNTASLQFPTTEWPDWYAIDVEFTQTQTCPTCPDCSFCPCSSPVTGPDQVSGIMTTLLDCAYAAIDHTGDLAINRKGVVLGDVAWDDCQCGQLVIKEDRRYGSMSFPVEEVSNEDDCGEPWLVTVYTLSLARCVPIPDQNGVAPDVSLLQTAATQLNKDMSQMRRAVSCCLDAQFNSHTLSGYQLGAQEINGPQGGCLETTLQILIGTPQNCGCS